MVEMTLLLCTQQKLPQLYIEQHGDKGRQDRGTSNLWFETTKGGAPGFVLGNVRALPGLPSEMEAMFECSV